MNEYKVMKVFKPMDAFFITSNREVVIAQTAQVTFTCPMNFKKFPFSWKFQASKVNTKKQDIFRAPSLFSRS